MTESSWELLVQDLHREEDDRMLGWSLEFGQFGRADSTPLPCSIGMQLEACSPGQISDPIPMVQIDIAYQGTLRCEANHGPSTVQLVTDAPVDNQGRGASFSPTDLLATALGTCMLTIMGIAAQKREWDLSGTSARVIKHMVADPARRVGRLEVNIQVPSSTDERQREVLEASAKSCPVANSIGESVIVDLSFSWTD